MERRLKILPMERRLKILPMERRLKILPMERRLKILPMERRLKILRMERRLKILSMERRRNKEIRNLLPTRNLRPMEKWRKSFSTRKRIAIYDISATELEAIHQKPLDAVNVFIFTYSIDNFESLVNIRDKWVPRFRDSMTGKPAILLGTKKDLRDKLQVSNDLAEPQLTLVSPEEGSEVRKCMGFDIFKECSSNKQYKEDIINLFRLISCFVSYRSIFSWRSCQQRKILNSVE
ncbi:hypothetical protein CEXT_223721 [Caerostris extrusa]|uniref:Uncharacterized protein n=1 Tax=Caerostris extrusa TaxID=172846 RepID=A0AAV4XTX9_CAEEX|nr:hypothetical protein CEXT_223721 [Caerostris extrusa]